MKQKVLVTGATGYIGSHICKQLHQAGYIVAGVDRVPREHTEKYMHEFVHADYASTEMFDWLESNLPDAVVHCAGTSLVGPSLFDPAEYHVNNVAKTAYFMAGLRQLPNMPAFVFSSSAAVYGAPKDLPILENAPWSPMSPYGQSKAAIEIMLADYAMAYGAKVMALRYFNACGADLDSELGQAPGATHIIARLLEAVRDNKEFTLYGNDYATPDGTCIRDYVHVHDLARAHVMAVEYLLSDQARSGALNLGTGQGYSNQEIIDAVVRLVGPVEIAAGPRRRGDPDQLVAKTDQAKATLGWQPEHSDLDTIISSAWKWYNNPSQSIDNSSK